MTKQEMDELIIEISVPYFFRDMTEIPDDIRKTAIKNIKKGAHFLNGNCKDFNIQHSVSFEGNGRIFEKKTCILTKGKNPFSEPGVVLISDDIINEISVRKTSSKHYKHIYDNDTVNTTDIEICEYSDGSKLVVFLYKNSQHQVDDQMVLAKHYNASGELLTSSQYPLDDFINGLLGASYMPCPEDYIDEESKYFTDDSEI